MDAIPDEDRIPTKVDVEGVPNIVILASRPPKIYPVIDYVGFTKYIPVNLKDEKNYCKINAIKNKIL